MAGLPSGGIMFLAHALAGTHWLLCIMFAGFGIYFCLPPTHFLFLEVFLSHPPSSSVMYLIGFAADATAGMCIPVWYAGPLLDWLHPFPMLVVKSVNGWVCA